MECKEGDALAAGQHDRQLFCGHDRRPATGRWRAAIAKVGCALLFLVATGSPGAAGSPHVERSPEFGLAAAQVSESGASPDVAAQGHAFTAGAATELVPVGTEPRELVASVTTDGDGVDAAFDGTNFLVAWYEGGDLRAAFVSPDGVIVGPGVINVNGLVGNGYRPSVSFDGTNFLVAWTENDPAATDDQRRVLGVRVSGAGSVLDAAPIVIGTDAKLRRISVAFDGTNYLAIWRTSVDVIRGARVSTAGTVVDSAGFTIGGGFYPWVTYAAGKYLVAWHTNGNGQDIVGAFVAPDGTVGAPFTIDGGPGDQEHVSVATDGTDFLVTFNDGSRGDQQNSGGAAAVRVTASGTVLDDTPIQVSDLEWRQGSKQTVAFDGTDYVVAWPEYKYPVKHRLSDIYARRISPAGAIVDADPVPIATGMGHQTGPTIEVAGSRYLVAYFDGCSIAAACLRARLLDRVSASPTSIVGSPGSAKEVATWTTMPSPINAPIHTVWALSDDSAFAGTEPDENELLEWDGSAWSVAAMLPNARKYGIWAGSPTRVFTIGSFGNMALWDGTSVTTGGNLFTDETTPLTVMGTGIRGFGGWNIFFSGVDGVVAHHVGDELSTWSGGACSTLDGQPYSYWGQYDCVHIRGTLDNWDIGGTFPNDVYVVGEMGTLAHYDGQRWSVVGVPTRESLNGVYTSCAGDTYAVGDFGTILHRDGTTWSRMASPTTRHLFAVAGFGSDDVYAVGDGGTIIHYDGTAWSPESSGTGNLLEDVAVGGSTVWVVGAPPDAGPGTILRKQRQITDTTAPKNPLLVSPTHPAGTWTANSTIKVNLQGGCDDGLGIDGYSVALDHNPTTIPPTTKNRDATTESVSQTVADGEWWFHLRTVDRAGHWSATSTLGPLRVDTTPPSAPVVTTDPAPGIWSNRTHANVTWSSADDASGIAGWSYSADPTTNPADTSIDAGATATGATVNTGPGDWYVHVRTVDTVGNWSQNTTIGPLRIDWQPPQNPVLTGTVGADRTITVQLTGASDDASGVAGFAYSFDQTPGDEPPTIKNLDATALAVTSPTLPLGIWSFHLRTVDAAGNWSGQSVIGFEVAAPPVTTIDSGPSGPTNDPTPTFTFSANEPATFECRVDAGAFATCASPHTTAALSDGTHTFQVRASNTAGGLGSAVGRSFTVDTTAPDTTIDSGPSGTTTDPTPTFTFSASEAGATFQCRVDGADFAACNSPYTTTTLATGAHMFDVRALDALGNTDATPASRAFVVSAPRVGKAVLTLVSRSVTVTRARIAAVKLRCGTEARCQGVLTLTTTVRGTKVKLGSSNLSIAAGRTATVKVKLTVAGYKLLVKARRLSAKAQLSYKQPTGARTATTAALKLKASPKR